MTHVITIRWCPKDALDGMQALDAMEELAYRRIIDLIYVTDDNIPDDDKKLAWMTKTGKEWKRVKKGLIALGKIEVKDGKIVQRKCQLVLTETHVLIEQNRAAGKASAEKRKLLKQNETASTSVITTAPTTVPTEGATKSQHPNQPASKPVTSKKESTPPLSSVAITPCEEKNSAAPVSDFQKVFDRGCQLFPALMTKNSSAIHQWLSAGCSIDLDILPTLERNAGKDIGSWKYFTDAVADSKSTRERPMPNGSQRTNGSGAAHTPAETEPERMARLEKMRKDFYGN